MGSVAEVLSTALQLLKFFEHAQNNNTTKNDPVPNLIEYVAGSDHSDWCFGWLPAAEADPAVQS